MDSGRLAVIDNIFQIKTTQYGLSADANAKEGSPKEGTAMKKTMFVLSALVFIVFFNSAVFAVCAPGSSWTASWTDSYGQTTYTMEAPCKVYIGIPFTITALVTDNAYPNNYVACLWSITDNGSVIADGGAGLGWLSTVNGQWQKTMEITYTGIPVDHTLQFSFLDLGQGGGAHFWGTKLIGDVTVDPYPPSANKPPVAEAGPDIYLTSDNRNSAIVQGTAFDADGNPLTYRWLEGDSVLQSFLAVDESGNAPLDLLVVSPLSIGAHTLTLEVSDGVVTVTDTVVVSVENSPPIAAPAGGATVQIGENISLNGDVADHDGDTLSYKWMEGDIILAEGVISTCYGGKPVPLPEQVLIGGLSLGSHTLTLQVRDGINTASATIVVNVIDTIAPTLAPAASTNILWPPNGGMTEVTINTNARDNSGGPVMLSVRMSSNEAPQKNKDGNIIPDYVIVSIDQSSGIIVLQLRAARSGKGKDRIYSITITATDALENSADVEVLIKALHDRGLHEGRSPVSRGLGKNKGH